MALAAFCLAVSAAGVEEIGRMASLRGVRVCTPLVHAFGAACVGAAYWGETAIWRCLPAIAVLAGFSLPVIGHRRFRVPDGLATQATALYVPYLAAHLLLVRGMDGGSGLALFTLGVTWITDTSAYLVGRRLGKHKMCPALSPAKSWEGAVAGAVFATALGALCGPALGEGVGRAAAGALGVSIAAQVGDLFESAVKRWTGVKDSGRIIPGHGGVLDRFDSLLFAAPAVYWLARFAGR
jgi:phosphatidate cytidylyltransferase